MASHAPQVCRSAWKQDAGTSGRSLRCEIAPAEHPSVGGTSASHSDRRCRKNRVTRVRVSARNTTRTRGNSPRATSSPRATGWLDCREICRSKCVAVAVSRSGSRPIHSQDPYLTGIWDRQGVSSGLSAISSDISDLNCSRDFSAPIRHIRQLTASRASITYSEYRMSESQGSTCRTSLIPDRPRNC